jgi:hypothetical protein
MKRFIIRFCILFVVFILTPAQSVFAEDKEAEYLWGEVSYDDYSGVNDENIETYIPTDCDTYEINLDTRYKIHIELDLDITTSGQDGNVNFSISQDELSKGFYEDIYLSRYEECRNNIIDIELDPGTYQLQVGFVSGESDSVSYSISLEYTRINSKAEAMNDNATISFETKSYTLTMEEVNYYDDGCFDFYDEVNIKSDLIYEPFEVTWKSSNKRIASVDKEGDVTAHAPGTITLTATLPNGKKASCTITVPDPTFKISKTKSTIYVGESISINVIANPADQIQKIQWTSSSKSIASVGINGKVTGKKAGKCTISAKLPNGKVLKCNMTVKAKPEIVDVADYLNDPNALSKKQNDSFEFKYKNGKITYALITGEDRNNFY